jgi:hypothetical protein
MKSDLLHDKFLTNLSLLRSYHLHFVSTVSTVWDFSLLTVECLSFQVNQSSVKLHARNIYGLKGHQNIFPFCSVQRDPKISARFLASSSSSFGREGVNENFYVSCVAGDKQTKVREAIASDDEIALKKNGEELREQCHEIFTSCVQWVFGTNLRHHANFVFVRHDD